VVKPGCSGFAAAQQDRDLVGKLLEDWYAPSAEVCCAACTKKQDCQGFSFASNTCFLKGDIEGTYAKVGVITQIKVAVLPLSTSAPAAPVAPTPAPPVPTTPSMSTPPTTVQQGSRCASFEAEAADTDMSGILLAARWAATSDDCCPLCEEAAGCEGYAFVNQLCYLKGNFTGTYYNWGVVTRLASRVVKPGCSGFAAAQQDRDLAGKLLEDWYAPAPEVCCAACTRKQDCGGFSFVNSRCYLKGDIEGTYNLLGALTRVKEGGVRRLMESGLMVV